MGHQHQRHAALGVFGEQEIDKFIIQEQQLHRGRGEDTEKKQTFSFIFSPRALYQFFLCVLCVTAFLYGVNHCY